MSHQEKIYLASKSPRRKELLQQVGIAYEVLLLRDAPPRGPDVTEIVLPGEKPQAYVARVTQEKAEMAWKVIQLRGLPQRPVLAADTTVVLGEQILGKPANRDAAIAMLSQLAGQTHQVLTSIAVRSAQGLHTVTQCSDVSFAAMSPAEIAAYCDTSEPYDKAGGYGIQGAAARYIANIRGSYSGIMGLPIFETCQLLEAAGVRNTTDRPL